MLYSYRVFLYQQYLNLVSLFNNQLELRDYLLTLLFYYFLGVNLEQIVLEHKGLVYNQLTIDEAENLRPWILEKVGYFLLPNELFPKVCQTTNQDLELVFPSIWKKLEQSTLTTNYRQQFLNLFSFVDLTADLSLKEKRNDRLKACCDFLQNLVFPPLGKYDVISEFSDIFANLLTFFAPENKPVLGQFISSRKLCRLLAGLVYDGAKKAITIHDPVCGSASLLLEVGRKYRLNNVRSVKLVGMDIDFKIHQIAKMNCLLHGLQPTQFEIVCDSLLNNLTNQQQGPFDIIVAEPTIHTNLDYYDFDKIVSNKLLELDISKLDKRLDFFLVLYTIQHLATDGKAAIVTYPGLFYRLGVYHTLRKVLLEQNLIEAIISLPSNFLFHTNLNPQILVLRKDATRNKILFIDSSKKFCTSKEQINQKFSLDTLSEENLAEILRVYRSQEEKIEFSRLVALDSVKKNNYLLSVDYYVNQMSI